MNKVKNPAGILNTIFYIIWINVRIKQKGIH